MKIRVEKFYTEASNPSLGRISSINEQEMKVSSLSLSKINSDWFCSKSKVILKCH